MSTRPHRALLSERWDTVVREAQGLVAPDGGGDDGRLLAVLASLLSVAGQMGEEVKALDSEKSLVETKLSASQDQLV